MRPEDVYQLTGVSDPRLRPGADEVAYVVWSIDGDENEYRQSIWLATDGRLRNPAPADERRQRRTAALVARRRPARLRRQAR